MMPRNVVHPVVFLWALLAVISGGHAGKAAGAVSEDVARLKYRRAVIFENRGPGTGITVEEDSLLAAGARPDFGDVRLMNEAGEAIAMERIRPDRVTVTETLFRELPFEWSRGSDQLWGATFDLGTDPPPVLAAELVGPVAHRATRFFGSADGEEWSLLTRDPIEEIPSPKEAPARVYPGDRFRVLGVRRFLRLVIDEGVPEPTSQDRIRLLIREESYTTRAEVPFRVLEAGYAAGSNERWSETLELTGPARLITRLDVRGLRPGTGKYSIAVEARLPEGIWSDLYAGDPTGWTEGKMDSLVVEPVRASAIRLQVQGADAPNAPFEVVRVLATPQSWRFEAEPGTDYWLGYGDPFAVLSASVPLVEPIASARVSVARLGPPEANPFFQEPGFGLEWLRRRPAVLTVVMAAILLAVAWLTLRGRAHARTEH